MKKYLLILIIVLVSTIGTAQRERGGDNDRRMNKEKIEALSVAYITEQLELTPDEASKFWPVFNELRERHHKLVREKKTLIQNVEDKYETLTDAQAINYIDKVKMLETQIHNSTYEKNSAKIIEIIGGKRFLKLMKAENDFRRKILKEYKERRGRDKP